MKNPFKAIANFVSWSLGCSVDPGVSDMISMMKAHPEAFDVRLLRHASVLRHASESAVEIFIRSDAVVSERFNALKGVGASVIQSGREVRGNTLFDPYFEFNRTETKLMLSAISNWLQSTLEAGGAK